MASIERRCTDCGKTFTINDGEQVFYITHGLALPKRCKKCREIKKNNQAPKSPTYTRNLQPVPNQRQEPKKAKPRHKFYNCCGVMVDLYQVQSATIRQKNRNDYSSFQVIITLKSGQKIFSQETTNWIANEDVKNLTRELAELEY